jgi:hypothetical protein
VGTTERHRWRQRRRCEYLGGIVAIARATVLRRPGVPRTREKIAASHADIQLARPIRLANRLP